MIIFLFQFLSMFDQHDYSDLDVAVSSFSNFLDKIASCIKAEDGDFLAELLNPMAYTLQEPVVGELARVKLLSYPSLNSLYSFPSNINPVFFKIPDKAISAQISARLGHGVGGTSSTRDPSSSVNWIIDFVSSLKAIFLIMLAAANNGNPNMDNIALWKCLSDMKM